MAVTPEVLAENVVPVLDHGFVALDGALASDLAVVNGARVSFNQASDEMGEKDAGLIRFLMRERHGSPFEHGYFRFIVKAPLFVVREHHRHQSRPFIQRVERALFEDRATSSTSRRTFAPRSASRAPTRFEPVEDEVRENAQREIEENATRAFQAYERMLEQGVAKEVARCGASALDVHEVLLELQSAQPHALLLAAEPRGGAVRDPPVTPPPQRSFLEQQMPITHAAFVANDRTAP